MKKTVYADEFVRAFDDMGRGDYFSLAGRYALYYYLLDLEDSVGKEVELDVVALCCEYSEYSSALEAFKDHHHNKDGTELAELDIDWLNADEAEDDELIEEKAREYIENDTTVIPFDGGVIIQAY